MTMDTSTITSYCFDKETGLRLDLPEFIEPGTRALCLSRVSADKQLYFNENNEPDIPMQRVRCRKFCEQMGWTVVCELSEEGVSGHKVRAENRDKIQLIKRYAQQGKFDILVVFMFDRIGRIADETPFVVEWLVKNGIRVWSTQEGEQKFETHTDKLTNYIRYWQADGESEKISIRTANSLRILTEAGCFTGGNCPYGYSFVHTGRTNKKKQPVNDLAVLESEAAIVRMMFRLAYVEGYGPQRIANHVNRNGIKNRDGVNWHPSTIRGILRNCLYTGILQNGGASSGPLEELRIVDDMTFYGVKEMMDARSSKNNSTRSAPHNTRGKALLSGFVFCGCCGARLCVTTSGKYGRMKDNERTVRMRYTCQTKSRTHGDCTGQTGYTVEKLDDIVNRILRFIFSRVRNLDSAEVLDACIQSDLMEKRAVLKKMRQDYTEAEKNYQRLMAEIVNALAGQSVFTPEILNGAIEHEKQKCVELRVGVAQMERELADIEDQTRSKSEQYNKLLNWATAYDAASMSAKKVIASQVIDRVDVFRGYKLNVKLNIGVEQFLSGLDIDLENTVSVAQEASA